MIGRRSIPYNRDTKYAYLVGLADGVLYSAIAGGIVWAVFLR